MADDGVLPTRRCASCGGEYWLEFFRRNHRSNGDDGFESGSQQYRNRCIGCEAIKKREEPMTHRIRRKAVATRRRHGLKLKTLGIIKREIDLEEMYGWSVDRMVDDIERVIAKGCPYCLQPIGTSAQALGTVTIDILNADQAPHYSTNIVWCCARCNGEKQRISSEIWGARQSMWNRWYLNQSRLGVNPEDFGFLPAGHRQADLQPTLW